MKHGREKGNWALLTAFFAFALPAALIGFLALGMVVDQKKIREDEIRNAWGLEIGRKARSLEAVIAERTRALFDSVASSFTPAADRPAFLASLKTLFVEQHDLSYPFLFSLQGVMVIPGFGDSLEAKKSGWMEKWHPPVVDRQWFKAEHAEFTRQQPLAAIPLYLALEKRLPQRALPDLYFAVCRCYFKAGKMIQSREYGLDALRQLEGALPRPDRLDLFILRQLGLIAMRLEMPQEAFSRYLRLYETLATGPAELPPDLQFLRWEALDFLKNSRDIQPFLQKERISEIDEKILDLYRGEISLFSDLEAPVASPASATEGRDRFLKLKEIFDPETSDTLFYRHVEKQFPGWLPAGGGDEINYRSGIFQNSPYLLAFTRLVDEAVAAPFYFGCRLQLQELLAASWPALSASLPLPAGTTPVLAPPHGEPLRWSEGRAGEATILAVPGQGALAGWSILLQAGDDRVFTALASRSLRWYYTLIAALFVSLGLGIVLLLRYLGNERKLLRQKADFVDMTSHTLKTPLTRLRLLAEKLEQGWTAEPERGRDHCRAIADETANMAQLVDRMLDFSALQSGRVSYHFEPRPVGEWLDEVLQKFKLPFAEKEFQVEVKIAPALPPVRIDPQAMATAFANLVENALQHAAAGKYIGISAAARGACLEIAVNDHGPGIALKDRLLLFEPFIHGGGGKSSGRGLGLAICRQIVEAHRGAVRAEEARGGGSRFVITLPWDLK